VWFPAVIVLVLSSGPDGGVVERSGHNSQREPADAAIQPGEIQIVGLLDERIARPILNAAEGDVRRCRDRFARSRAGRFPVRFLVSEEGTVPTVIVIRS